MPFKFLIVCIVCNVLFVSATEFDVGTGNTQDTTKFSTANRKWNITQELTQPPYLFWWAEKFYSHQLPAFRLQCPNSSCIVSNVKQIYKNRYESPAALGVLFYGSEMDVKDMPLPRYPRHLWGLIHEESPLNNWMVDHHVSMSLFNFTSTYHRDSDWPLTTISIPSVANILDREPVPLAEKNRLQNEKSFAPVLYVQSHCEVPSDRDSYVEELMKYIPVDSYGKCVHNKDLPEEIQNPVETMHHDMFLELASQYKFTLAFENGICNDYTTEKLYRPLHLGSVPVYRGSPFAKDFTPQNSIIMVDDFKSPRELAKFLTELNNNDTAYEEYLEFKRSKEITNPKFQEAIDKRPWKFTDDPDNYGRFTAGFECQFCDYLNKYNADLLESINNPDVEPPAAKITDGRKFACPAPQPHNPENPPEWWNTYQLPESYWSGLDDARGLRDMILAGETDSTNHSKYAAKYRRDPNDVGSRK